MSRVNDALTRAMGDRPAASDVEPSGPTPESGVLLHAEEAAQLWPTERHGEGPAIEAPKRLSDPPSPPQQPAAEIQDRAPRGFSTVHRSASAKLVLNEDLDPDSVEQYRRLAARLHLDQVQHGTKLVMITSALVGEGKTLTATNLALTLSESYRKRVLLVDADLRRPGIHATFGIPNFTGLSDAIRSSEERQVSVIHLTEHLSVLTAGRPDSDPMSVLTSERMQRVLRDAAAAFDWVIIDTPPVALLSDAHLLATLVDTVILVVRAGVTPLESIRAATEAVGRDRILGVVLNSADIARRSPYQYYPRRETTALTVTS